MYKSKLYSIALYNDASKIDQEDILLTYRKMDEDYSFDCFLFKDGSTLLIENYHTFSSAIKPMVDDCKFNLIDENGVKSIQLMNNDGVYVNIDNNDLYRYFKDYKYIKKSISNEESQSLIKKIKKAFKR